MYFQNLLFVILSVVSIIDVNIVTVKAVTEEEIDQVAVEPEGEYFSVEDEHPLIQAAIGGSPDQIQELIQDGADVNFQSPNGWTATIAAVENNQYENLLKLIELEADLNIQEADGWTCLMFAAYHV